MVMTVLNVHGVVFQTKRVRHIPKIPFAPTTWWKLEKRAQEHRVQNRLSFPEARMFVEMATQAVVGKSYAATAAPKLSAKSIAISTDQ